MAADRPPRLRLFDILDCIREIDRATSGVSFDEFRADTLRYRAVERFLEIISEASRHIDATWKDQEAAIEWKQIADLGNVMRHGYEIIDVQIIWNIVKHDLPRLKAAAERIYAQVKQPADPWPDAEST